MENQYYIATDREGQEHRLQASTKVFEFRKLWEDCKAFPESKNCLDAITRFTFDNGVSIPQMLAQIARTQKLWEETIASL